MKARRTCGRCGNALTQQPTRVLIIRPGRQEHARQVVALCQDCDLSVARLLAAQPVELNQLAAT